MTTYPIVEQIRRLIVTRITTMLGEVNIDRTRAADIAEPTRTGGYSPEDFQIVVTQDEATRNQTFSTPGNPPAVAYDQMYTLRCKVLVSETAETAIDELVNKFVCDAQKIITSYVDWHTMNGLAIDAEFDAPVKVDNSGGAVVTNLPLVVTYRVSETDPYALR